MDTMGIAADFGALLRSWRRERHLSQADLANDVGTPSRHISFLETGRARPSRTMVARLVSSLRIPIRDRNGLLRAAGFADQYPEQDIADFESSELRQAVTRIMNAQSPCPAFVIDRSWNVLDANGSGKAMLELVSEEFPHDPPATVINLVDAALSPSGFKHYIVDWEAFARQFIQRLHRESASDQVLADRMARVRDAIELPDDWWAFDVAHTERPFFPIRMRMGGNDMTFFGVVAAVALPTNALAQELRVETLFPADDATERLLVEGGEARAML